MRQVAESLKEALKGNVLFFEDATRVVTDDLNVDEVVATVLTDIRASA